MKADQTRRRSKDIKRKRSEHSKEIIIDDQDVWFDDPNHPGTKDLRRAIRLILEDYPDRSAKFTKKVYKALVEDHQGRQFYTGENLERLQLCQEDSLVDRIGSMFDLEKERRIEKRSSKKKVLLENNELQKSSSKRSVTSDTSLSSLKRERNDERKKRRPQSKKNCRKSDYGSVTETSLTSIQREGSSRSKPKRTSSSRRPKCSDWESEQRTSKNRTRDNLQGFSDEEYERVEQGHQHTKGDPNVYLFEEDTQGTKMLRATIRKILRRSEQTRFSRSVFDKILQKMDERKFFQSREEKREVPTKDLIRIIGQMYEEEKVLMHARPRDVYFQSPSHPGTKDWVQAVQQVALEYREESDFDKKIYREIKNRFDGSNFYIGKAPDFEKATRNDLMKIFEERFQAEKAKLELIRQNKAKTAGRERRRSPAAYSGTVSSGRARRRPLPGDLYWHNLGRAIASRFLRWECFQTKRRQIAGLPLIVCCRKTCEPIRRTFGTDPRTGRSCLDRLAEKIEIPIFGQRSKIPVLALLFTLYVVAVFMACLTVMKHTLFGLLGYN